MKALATSLLIIYGLSIMGYALLDATHELLHSVKNPFHQHEVKMHAHEHKYDHHHHHIEDHQKLLTESDTNDKQVPSVSISWYFLFFHGAAKFNNAIISLDIFAQLLNKRLPIVFLIPPSPPPLCIPII